MDLGRAATVLCPNQLFYVQKYKTVSPIYVVNFLII